MSFKKFYYESKDLTLDAGTIEKDSGTPKKSNKLKMGFIKNADFATTIPIGDQNKYN